MNQDTVPCDYLIVRGSEKSAPVYCDVSTTDGLCPRHADFVARLARYVDEQIPLEGDQQ